MYTENPFEDLRICVNTTDIKCYVLKGANLYAGDMCLLQHLKRLALLGKDHWV